VPGWPVTVTTEVNSSPAVGDINGDGFNEGIGGIGGQDRSDDGAIHDFSPDGFKLPGWPVITQDRNLGVDGHSDGIFAPPAVVDLDGDSVLDIVVGSPVISDLDNNGDLEIVVPIGWDLVRFNHDESSFKYAKETQLCLHTLLTAPGTPIVVDVDGNCRLEVFIGFNQCRSESRATLRLGTPRGGCPGCGAMTDVAEELGSLWRTEESNSYQERG